MKRGAPEHPKMLVLAGELEKLLPAEAAPECDLIAAGVVERLLHWTPRYAIRGDVGKWPNSVIARGLGWLRDPDALIAALITSGWLDVIDGPARLVLHDCVDHADNVWRQCLEDAGLSFWDGSQPRKHTCKKQKIKQVSRNSSQTPVKLQSDSSKTPGPDSSKTPGPDSSKTPGPDSSKTPQPEPEPEPEPEPVERSSSNSREHRAREAPVSTIPQKPKPLTTNRTPTTPPAKRLGSPPDRAPPPLVNSPEEVTKLMEARNALIRFARACPGPAATWDYPDWALVTGVLQRLDGDLKAMSLMLQQLEAQKSQPGSSWGWFLTCAEKWSRQEVS